MKFSDKEKEAILAAYLKEHTVGEALDALEGSFVKSGRSPEDAKGEADVARAAILRGGPTQVEE